MILPSSYTPEWIFQKKQEYLKSDQSIMEKVIYALALVEELVGTNLPFVFKGGTSLLLILPEPKRFSIDVDIVTTASREQVEASLTKICTQGVFLNFELDERRSYKPGIPKAHYLITFNSQLENTARVILLDILYEEHGYPALVQAPITNEWIQTDNNILTVSIPSVDSIAGDKLTAYGPNTIGIRYGRDKKMEIMKQLFDIGILFDRLSNKGHFTESFERTAKKEIGYRIDETITREDVLNDMINTSLMIASIGKLFNQTGNFKEISDGLNQLKSYIYNGNFRIDDAIVASSKAAYLASILLTGHQGAILQWQDDDDIKKYMIEPENLDYQFLNKKRNIPGGSLFYWKQTFSLLGWLK